MSNDINAVTIRNLSVYYKKNIILNNIGFDIFDGEVMGMLGASGCGKTSLAKAILGMDVSYKGDIILKYKNPMMVFQDSLSALNKVKKIGWLLEEPLRCQNKMSKSDMRIKAEQMLLDIGLDESYYNRYPIELSGGQRQRVCVGIALIGGSKFIVLDEATSSLDVTVQQRILGLLKKLKKKHNLTYLFISHDINVIYQICDRVMVMNKGKIIEIGDTKDIFLNPKSEFTKDLIRASLLE